MKNKSYLNNLRYGDQMYIQNMDLNSYKQTFAGYFETAINFVKSRRKKSNFKSDD